MSIAHQHLLSKEFSVNNDEFILFRIKFSILDPVLDQVERLGDILFSDTSLFEHFEHIITKYISRSSLRRGTAQEEIVLSLAVLILVTSVSTEIQEKRNAKLVKDGTEKHFRDGLITNTIAFDNIDNDARPASVSKVLEVIQGYYSAACKVPLPLDVILKVLKSVFIHNDKNIALSHHNQNTKCIDENLAFPDCIRRAQADGNFGLSDDRDFSAVLEEGDDKLFQFLILFSFPVNIHLNNSSTGNFASVLKKN